MAAETFRLYDESELGRDGYPPIWHETLKHSVREDAAHRCLRCGHPYKNGEHGTGEWSPCDYLCTHLDPIRVRPILSDDWQNFSTEGLPVGQYVTNLLAPMFVQAQWRILTVHHLDGDKANCRWWNLAALCQRCHLEIQGRVRMDQVYPFEHSEWFRPFAAAYYAHAYLGEDLSRAEVGARLDELLALERVA